MKYATLLTAWLALVGPSFAADKPNILFILADDIGYSDLSCYGAKHAQTPHLDKLAAAGCKFTDSHSPASTCTPTRRAFLTGRYSWRQQPGSGIAPGDAPLTIPPGTPTVASLLKSAGYRTGVVGKWHLGLGPEGGPDWNNEIKPGPLEIGFDYAFLMPATGDRVPTVYVENHRIVGLDPADPITVSYKQKVGTEPTGKENPELLKLKHTHGHDMTIVNGVGRIGWMTGGKAALWKDEDMADTYTKKAIAFIESSKDKPFFLYFASHNIHVPRVPHPRFKGASPVGTRGDAIHELDAAVGELLATLDRLKLADNTLVIFTSDNGGVMDDGYEDVGKADYHPNAPLRGGKGTLFEGGTRVPFIARWPGQIKPGIGSDALFAHLDMPATFAAIAGAKIPAGGCADSVNVLPALLGQSKTGRADFVSHVGGTKGPFALRAGQWKFIQAGGGGYGKAAKGEDKKPQPQLYNLADDLAEQANLAAKQPEKLAELRSLLDKIKDSGHNRP
jgi:arylsulfatase A-like enzyme